MKIIRATFFVLGLFSAVEDGRAEPIHLPLIEITSPHGIKIALLQSDAQDTVAIALAFDRGIASDAIDGPATSHLAPQLLTEGAGGKTASEVFESFQDFGGYFRIESTTDQTYALLSAPRKGIMGSANLAHLILTKPDYPPKALERRREALAQRVEENAADPEFKVSEALRNAAYERHAYDNYFAVTSAAVRATNLRDLQPWAAEHFVRKGVLVSVVGNISAAQAGLLVDALLDGLPESSSLPPTPPVKFKERSGKAIDVTVGSGEQAIVEVGAFFPRDVALKDWLAGYMLGKIFAGDQKSRLFKDIRNTTGATYGMQTSTAFYEALTTSFVAGRVAKKDLAATVAQILKSWDMFRLDGPNAVEIANAKASMRQELAVALLNHEALASLIRDYLTGHWQVAELAKLPSAIEDANLNDSAVLSRYFGEKPIVVIGQ